MFNLKSRATAIAAIIAIMLTFSLLIVNASDYDNYTDEPMHQILTIDNFDDLFEFVSAVRAAEGIEIALGDVCDTCGTDHAAILTVINMLRMRSVDLPLEYYMSDLAYLIERVHQFLQNLDADTLPDTYALIAEAAENGLNNFFHVNDVIFSFLLEQLFINPLESFVNILPAGVGIDILEEVIELVNTAYYGGCCEVFALPNTELIIILQP
jgi:hypothetical protein